MVFVAVLPCFMLCAGERCISAGILCRWESERVAGLEGALSLIMAGDFIYDSGTQNTHTLTQLTSPSPWCSTFVDVREHFFLSSVVFSGSC